MDIVVNEELKAYIDPLTPEEYEALERSLLAEGCRDALVLWGEVLVDGHNRYGICRKHDIPFNTVQNTRFRSMEDVHLWMIDQHLGRRSLSDFQRGVLALRKREIVSAHRAGAAQAGAADDAAGDGAADAAAESYAQASTAASAPLDTREALARAARLSNSQVLMIEKIQKQAAPELVAAVRSGAISLNAAAAVASLPTEEQAAAASAGAAELKQAAKRVREANRKPRAEKETPAAEPVDDGATPQALRERVAALSAENTALRQEVASLQAQLRDLRNAAPADASAPF